MGSRLKRILLLILLCPLGAPRLRAADWLMFGHDPQRSGWAVEEKDLSLENVGSLELKWKASMKNEPLSLASLTAPLVASNVTTPQGIKTLA